MRYNQRNNSSEDLNMNVRVDKPTFQRQDSDVSGRSLCHRKTPYDVSIAAVAVVKRFALRLTMVFN
jgi:hypothetical protein